MSYWTVNPTNQEQIKEYFYMPAGEVERRLRQSYNAWQIWRHSEIGQRKKFLKDLALDLRNRSEALAEQMALEMGKPIREGRSEVEKCALTCDFVEKQLADWLSPVQIPLDELTQGQVHKESLGPILAVMPWNFPLWQVIRFAAPAIAAGNTVCLKHSQLVSGTAEMLEEIFQKACDGSHLLLNFRIDHEQAAGLLRDSQIRGATFTGSTRGGREIARVAGESLKKTVLELGGSDAYLVNADADVEKAAEICAKARLVNSGQSCVAAKRFFIDKSIFAQFEKHFVSFFSAQVVGSPNQEKTEVGPMASLQFAQQLTEQVEDFKKRGAQSIWKNREVPEKGAFFGPEVLRCDPRVKEFHIQELFGPVALLFPVDSLVEAVEFANSSTYGLGAAIFSNNLETARATAELLDCGMVAINEMVKSDPRLPFGGVKDSGYGRELSVYGFSEFLNLKTVKQPVR